MNFNGTTATIRDQRNVTSITANSTGDFTINFTTALSNNTYCVNGNHSSTGSSSSSLAIGTTPSTTSCRVFAYAGGVAVNPTYVNVMIASN